MFIVTKKQPHVTDSWLTQHGPLQPPTTPAALCIPSYTFSISRAVGSFVTSPSALPSPSLTSSPGTPHSPAITPANSQSIAVVNAVLYDV